MRVMEIPRFPRELQFTECGHFIVTRMSQRDILWPDHASALVGYAWAPNDEAARIQVTQVLRNPDRDFQRQTRKAGRIQHEWLRVADIFHHWYDLKTGGHQERRGGPSLSKAVALVASHSKGRGASEANLWRLWERYKDVAHIVAAACAICREVRKRSGDKPFGPSGFAPSQFMPIQMMMLMPNLVLAVALEFERHGLEGTCHPQREPPLDSATVWRIPLDINVEGVHPPARSIPTDYLITLNKRRAGNRGKAHASGDRKSVV